jgi:hypothetical protein
VLLEKSRKCGAARHDGGDVTLPRPVEPGATLAITRRCILRKFLLKPSKRVNQVLCYCVAEAAHEFSIDVHAFCAMSNHVHLLVTDPWGQYPLFLERFFKLAAKALNCLYGRWGSLWDSEQPAVVRVVDEKAALAWLVYILCNPVKANLVAKAGEWPGVSSWAATAHGKQLGAERPGWFFDPKGTMPEEAWLEVTPPPMFEGTAEAWRKLVLRKVAEREGKYAAARTRRVLGRKAILAQSREASPDTPEPRREVMHRVAGHRKWARIEAILRDRAWLAAYKQALAKLREGTLDVVFPAFTWKMARLGMRVAPS